MKSRSELVAEQERVAKQIAELDAHEAKLGHVLVAVEKFHDLRCRWNHTDGCSWFYEKDEAFQNPESTHGQWITKYREAKIAVEKVLKHEVSDEVFLDVVEGLR